MQSRVYLDHAATSWPRLPNVVETQAVFEARESAAAGRGSYRSAVAISARIDQLRLKLSRMVNAKSHEVAFFANGTAANNYALAGVLRPGDHVITTRAEHNSILRPLRLLEQQRAIEWTAVETDATGGVDPAAVQEAIRPNTVAIVCTSASNVTGRLNDVTAIGAIAKQHGLLFLVDAAQSFGYKPIDMSASHIDALMTPGHKGGGGPLGTAVLVAREHLHARWQPLWTGGTGEQSDTLDGDFSWQQVAEAGNRNGAALVGWLAGLTWREQQNQAGMELAMKERYDRLHEILSDSVLGGLIGHRDDGFLPVFSLRCDPTTGLSLAASDLAAILDASFGIEVRSGFHCAALIHDNIRTRELGGTLRISLGATSTLEDVDSLAQAAESLRGMLKG